MERAEITKDPLNQRVSEKAELVLARQKSHPPLLPVTDVASNRGTFPASFRTVLYSGQLICRL